MMAIAPVRPVTVTGVAENWPGPEIPFPAHPRSCRPSISPSADDDGAGVEFVGTDGQRTGQTHDGAGC